MSATPDLLDRSYRYIEDVLTDEIPACKWVKLACQRQVDDRQREAGNDTDFPYVWNEDLALKVCRFVSLMPHIKGRWAKTGETLDLMGWQTFLLSAPFGWVDEFEYRRFKTVYAEVPRKNAKSTLSSAVGLYMLTADGEEGAEVYSAATTRDQARIVFDDARAMARKTPAMCEKYGLEVMANALTVENTASGFRSVSSEGKLLDGLNVHCAIIDELHAHRTREVWDVLETATGAREQPMMWTITTSGFNRSGICWEQRTYVTRILNNVLRNHPEMDYKRGGDAFADEEYFGIVYTIDDDDDWHDESSWIKANPNWDVSAKPADIRRKARKATEMPSAQNNFLTKHLCVWTNADVAWMDMTHWDAGKDSTLNINDFTTEHSIDGLDLASKIDITARVRVFRRKIDNDYHYYVFGQYYLPEEAIETSDNSQYEGWEESGLIETTPGNVTDYSYIQDDIEEGPANIREIAYDPYNATMLVNNLQTAGVPMVELRQTVFNFSEPMKELEALVLAGRLHHTGCPVLSWMIANVVCHTDRKGNIYPSKETPKNKIDGAIALIMALARWLAPHEEQRPSAYETRGVVVA